MDLKDFTTLDWFFAGQVGIVIAAYILSRIMKMFLNPVQNGILIVALLFAAWAGLHYFEVPTAVIKLAAFVTLTTFLCYYIYETTQLSFAALFLSMYVIIFMGLVGLDWHLDAQKLLNSYALQIGDYRISILFVLKVLFLVLFVHWLIGLFMEWFKRRVKSSRTMDNSQKLLLSRIIFVALYALAIISVLNVLGFDTATLAVFTGAIGLGVGIGLQSIASQIISGYILLFHKSVKPGDVIAVAGTYGEVRKMNTLYTSVITRDGKEHLIPNEDLINKPVENWSFSNSLVRLPIRVGVDYGTNIPRAMELMVEAALEQDRVLEDPHPKCILVEFADSSINFELRFWINDPLNGVAWIKGDVRLAIWEKFREHGVEFPYPQQDIMLKPSPEFTKDLGKSLSA